MYKSGITKEQLDDGTAGPILKKGKSGQGPERNHSSGAHYKSQNLMHHYGDIWTLVIQVATGPQV